METIKAMNIAVVSVFILIATLFVLDNFNVTGFATAENVPIPDREKTPYQVEETYIQQIPIYDIVCKDSIGNIHTNCDKIIIGYENFTRTKLVTKYR